MVYYIRDGLMDVSGHQFFPDGCKVGLENKTHKRGIGEQKKGGYLLILIN